MPARPTVEQVAQVGVEVTPGVPVAATWRPQASTLTIASTDESEEVRPSGSYFVTTTFLTGTASEGEAAGVPCYNELGPILDLVFGTATTVGTSGGAGGGASAPYTHTYRFGAPRPTWTVEYGDTTLASRASHMYATSLALEWGKNSRTATMTLGLGGGLFEDGRTLTSASAVDTFPVVPATALHVDLFVDTDADSYGTTKVTNALSVRWVLDGLASGTGYLDSETASISETVAGAPDASVEIMVDADAEGRAWRQLLVDGATRYMRIAATHPTLGYHLHLDMPVQVREVGARGDEDSQYVARYTLRITEAGADQLRAILRNGVRSVRSASTGDGDAGAETPGDSTGDGDTPAPVTYGAASDLAARTVDAGTVPDNGNTVALSARPATDHLSAGSSGFVVFADGYRVTDAQGRLYQNSALPAVTPPPVDEPDEPDEPPVATYGDPADYAGRTINTTVLTDAAVTDPAGTITLANRPGGDVHHGSAGFLVSMYGERFVDAAGHPYRIVDVPAPPAPSYGDPADLDAYNVDTTQVVGTTGVDVLLTNARTGLDLYTGSGGYIVDGYGDQVTDAQGRRYRNEDAPVDVPDEPPAASWSYVGDPADLAGYTVDPTQTADWHAVDGTPVVALASLPTGSTLYQGSAGYLVGGGSRVVNAAGVGYANSAGFPQPAPVGNPADLAPYTVDTGTNGSESGTVSVADLAQGSWLYQGPNGYLGDGLNRRLVNAAGHGYANTAPGTARPAALPAAPSPYGDPADLAGYTVETEQGTNDNGGATSLTSLHPSTTIYQGMGGFLALYPSGDRVVDMEGRPYLNTSNPWAGSLGDPRDLVAYTIDGTVLTHSGGTVSLPAAGATLYQGSHGRLVTQQGHAVEDTAYRTYRNTRSSAPWG